MLASRKMLEQAHAAAKAAAVVEAAASSVATPCPVVENPLPRDEGLDIVVRDLLHPVELEPVVFPARDVE